MSFPAGGSFVPPPDPPQLPSATLIIYEYPLKESIRTLLRLEDLFERTDHFRAQNGRHEHHVALINLFEILEVAARSDLRMDLISELERQRQVLLGFRNNPNISQSVLRDALHEVEQASSQLLNINGKLGQSLRDNEWLMNIKSRAAIPGGLCEFDLPSYHQWLHLPEANRQLALGSWTDTLFPLRCAATLVLRLLRDSGHSEVNLAQRGAFRKTLNNSPAQLVRIHMEGNDLLVPEISANRMALHVRFTQPNGADLRLKQVEADISFHLTLCAL